MAAQVQSPNRNRVSVPGSVDLGECTSHDCTSLHDQTETTFSSTATATAQRSFRQSLSYGNIHLAKPSKKAALRGPLSTHKQLENIGSCVPNYASESRDRFIARAKHSAVQSGGLAEACGVKSNRILEYASAPPLKRKYAPAEFTALYAQRIASQKQSDTPSRQIPNKPTKILDAPGILDDFYINVVDWSSAINYLAIGLNSTVYCWNPATSEVSVIAELDPDGNQSVTVSSLKWSNEDTCLAIATSEGEVQIWDAESGSLIRSMRGRSSERIAALSWNEPLLSSGRRNGSIWNHDIRVKQHKVAELRHHSGEICGLKWREDGRFLASGSNDNTVALWDARVTSVPKHQLIAHQAAVKALAWCPWQTNLLATGGGSADRQIHFWNTATGTCVNSIDTGSQITSLHWSREYKEIAGTLGYPYNSVAVWNYPTLSKQIEITGAHDFRILNGTLSMDNQTLVTCSADENIKFWNIFESDAKAKRQFHHQNRDLGSSFVPERI